MSLHGSQSNPPRKTSQYVFRINRGDDAALAGAVLVGWIAVRCYFTSQLDLVKHFTRSKR